MSSAWLLAMALAGSPGPELGEPLAHIEHAFAAGQLSEGRRLFYRIAALKAPHLLPPPWRPALRHRHEHTRECATPLLADAFQTLQRLGDEDTQDAQRLLAPPTDLALSVESTGAFPVRVSYASASLEAKARVVLNAVAESYQKEVIEWGFRPPPVEPGTGPYRIYLMEPGPGIAGYTSPYELNDVTDHVDAFTYIVIGPDADELSISATVAHEFNHACQVAMDVLEVTSFMENTATFIESRVFPEAFPYTQAFFRYFQVAPYRPIEFMQNARSDGYEYGGALWAYFLVHTYGNDDPRWIRQVWSDSEQTTGNNEPDYFDVLDATLAGEGGLRGAVTSFSRYRFFVGADDDGLHFPDSSHWAGAEVARSAWFSVQQLPLRDRGPLESASRPRPNGCNYIEIGVDTDPKFPVRFSFSGEAGMEWSAEVFALSNEADTVVIPIPLDDNNTGDVAVLADSVNRLVLSVCQLSAAGYDPDRRSWTAADYRYSVVLDVPPAVVTSVTPNQLARGSHGDLLTLGGSGFIDDANTKIALSGTKTLAELVQFVSPNELKVRLYVAPSAELGARDIVVTNPGSEAGTGAALLTIVEPAAPPKEEPPPQRGFLQGGGCVCAQTPPSPIAAWLLLAAGCAWLLRGQRRLLGLLVLVLLPSAARAAPIVGFVESQLHPIRVSYTEAIGETVAREALRYADATWESQINNMGFREPMMVDDSGAIVPGMRIELDNDAAYNHAEPVADIPATPWTDCAVKVSISTTTPSDYFRNVVNHETNHAMEMALDCTEAPFAFENTTVAVTTLLEPVNDLFVQYMLPVFQKNPQSGLDCTFFMDQNKRYYHYGASLFQVFLEEAYGSNNGRLMSAIWEAAKQDGTVVITDGYPETTAVNSPDLLTAIDTVLAAQGSSLAEAFGNFAIWRYFIAGNDDGAHFEHGGEWGGAEVAIDQDLNINNLPLSNLPPNHNPSDFGTIYTDLSLFGADPSKGLAFDFQGDSGVRWHVAALLIRADKTAVEAPILVDSNARGQLRWPSVDGFARAVFVVSNLGDGTHDSNNPQCNSGRTFTYGVSLTDSAVPPVLRSVDPGTLEVAKAGYVWINGAGFMPGATVSFSGSGIEVGEVKLIDNTVLGVAVTVAADAAPGARDVTVTNPRDQAATLSQVLTLAAPPAPPADEPRPFGCSTAAGGGPFELMSLLVLASTVRRQRHAR